MRSPALSGPRAGGGGFRGSPRGAQGDAGRVPRERSEEEWGRASPFSRSGRCSPRGAGFAKHFLMIANGPWTSLERSTSGSTNRPLCSPFCPLMAKGRTAARNGPDFFAGFNAIGPINAAEGGSAGAVGRSITAAVGRRQRSASIAAGTGPSPGLGPLFQRRRRALDSSPRGRWAVEWGGGRDAASNAVAPGSWFLDGTGVLEGPKRRSAR